MVRYYHATDYKNLPSILQNGIRIGIDGVVYCSKDEETAARWMMFSRRHAARIITIPFDRDEDDENIKVFVDSHPIMLQAIGANITHDEGASMGSDIPIPAEEVQANIEQILVWENPFYDPDFAKRFERLSGGETDAGIEDKD